MIINALNRYYDLLVQDGKSDIPDYGYSMANVAYALEIVETGELINIVPLEDQVRNKTVPRSMIVPEQPKRQGTKAPPYFLCDNSKYVLGIGRKDNQKIICHRE